ncbi:unnamed protein product [Zymoseptoria tritici ST99CH_1A5]|uniref:Uncharacterized protein n=1 Tax=Zymoseptoria tritici ST99CH_1A5 TaxID=1276529 RepID=A0A1Y6LCQ8_ZYMTR|nr:unnamed protein product [Zymoseptoria tritici ST99CH_3D1]SMY21130.1 unnamed protein product [Zymoseptoria tritici ST99CH_1A5]
MIRSSFRSIWKIAKWPFLLTLPVTFLPFLLASISGIIFAFWNDALIYDNTDKWLLEVKELMGDWGVGGNAPTFRQFQDTHNDFRTMRINSNDFLEKLDFILPEQYYDDTGTPTEDLPIDKYADIENLVRDTSPTARCGKPEKPQEQWLYLTDYGSRYFEWDEDFRQAVQFAQGDLKLNQTGLYFAQCRRSAKFLCGVWNTRKPALVHFLVEDYPLDALEMEERGFSYAGDMRYLRPVTVRIIEFPLEGQYTGLPWTTFPSNQEQMLSIMTGDHLYEQFEPYDPLQQMVTRFSEHMDEAYWNNKWHVLHYLNELEEVMQEHVAPSLGLSGVMTSIYQLSFILTGNAVSLCIIGPLGLVKEIMGAFLGKPARGDAILGDAGRDYSGEPTNILNDWFSGLLGAFIANVSDELAAESSKSVMQSASMTGHSTSVMPRTS